MPWRAAAKARRSHATGEQHHHRRKRWTNHREELRALHGPIIAVSTSRTRSARGPSSACAVIIRRTCAQSPVWTTPAARRTSASPRVKIRGESLDCAWRAFWSPRSSASTSPRQCARDATRIGGATWCNHVLIDGKRMRPLPSRTQRWCTATHAFFVACASIIAKVTRDHLMRRIALRHT